MMLSYAKLSFEDVQINREQLKTMKEEGQLENGQVPYLELEDGTKLFQGVPILNYIDYNLGFHLRIHLMSTADRHSTKISFRISPLKFCQLLPLVFHPHKEMRNLSPQVKNTRLLPEISPEFSLREKTSSFV